MGQLTYLILVLVWAVPIVVIEWLTGPEYLLRRWKVLLPGILVPTLYLILIDWLAINLRIWTANPEQSLAISLPVFHIPVEDVLFFLATNTLIVQSLILLRTPEMRARLGTLLRMIRRGPGGKPEA